MEMFMLLLVSAVAQLVSPVAAHPAKFQHLNEVIDAASKYNTSLYQEYFVEDVTELGNARCNATFYCKVEEILANHHHHHNTRDNEDKRVLQTLKMYINSRKINCEEALKNVKKSDTRKPLPEMLKNLTKCSRQINFNGH